MSGNCDKIEKSSLYILALRHAIGNENHKIELLVNSIIAEWDIFKKYQKLIILNEAEKNLSKINDYNRTFLVMLIDKIKKDLNIGEDEQ